jgi:phospho-2-dehydro-3-deoxyheptonate aldolase
MPKFAPEHPTTNILQEKYPLSPDHHRAILMKRQRVSRVLGQRSAELLAIIGPCAMTLDEDIIMAENARLIQFEQDNPTIAVLHRLPMWKPRTREEDWFGLETTDPEAAYRLLATCAIQGANMAVEMGTAAHLERYGDLVAFGWKGARSNDAELTQALASHSSLPVGIKNNLKGESDDAHNDIGMIMSQRAAGDAPATLLFRGGLNAQNPADWEEQLLCEEAITDAAHGGEMAHHLSGEYKKSIPGQVATLEHLIDITRRTDWVPSGVMIEASSATSPTDPVMPFEQALELVLALADAKAAAHSRSRKAFITV